MNELNLEILKRDLAKAEAEGGDEALAVVISLPRFRAILAALDRAEEGSEKLQRLEKLAKEAWLSRGALVPNEPGSSEGRYLVEYRAMDALGEELYGEERRKRDEFRDPECSSEV